MSFISFENPALIVWLALLVLFVVVELATVGLTSIWFAAGALAALILAALKAPIAAQVIVFLLVSVVMLVFTRPWAAKHINSHTEKTNVDSLIGKTARVTERISNNEAAGRADVNGQDWSARSDDDNVTIEPGELVRIVRVSGVKIIVHKKEEESLCQD